MPLISRRRGAVRRVHRWGSGTRLVSTCDILHYRASAKWFVLPYISLVLCQRDSCVCDDRYGVVTWKRGRTWVTSLLRNGPSSNPSWSARNKKKNGNRKLWGTHPKTTLSTRFHIRQNLLKTPDKTKKKKQTIKYILHKTSIILTFLWITKILIAIFKNKTYLIFQTFINLVLCLFLVEMIKLCYLFLGMHCRAVKLVLTEMFLRLESIVTESCEWIFLRFRVGLIKTSLSCAAVVTDFACRFSIIIIRNWFGGLLGGSSTCRWCGQKYLINYWGRLLVNSPFVIFCAATINSV